MLSSVQCWFQAKKSLYSVGVWKKTTQKIRQVWIFKSDIITWHHWWQNQLETILCSLLPCTLHIFTRTRLCQTKHGIMTSMPLHSFCSSPRTKLSLRLGKLFWFTNKGFSHTDTVWWILEDCGESHSYDHRLQNLAEKPCNGLHKSNKQERGLVH